MGCLKGLTEESSRSWVRGCVATSRTTRFPSLSNTLGREKAWLCFKTGHSSVRQGKGKLLLVQPDAVILQQLVHVVRRGGLQRPAPLAQHRRHGLHQLRRALLLSSLHHPDLSPSSSLTVPDVLGQHHGLENGRREDVVCLSIINKYSETCEFYKMQIFEIEYIFFTECSPFIFLL